MNGQGGGQGTTHGNRTNSRMGNMKKMAYNTLRLGELVTAVELPEGEDLFEWLAVNVIEFYNDVSMIYQCLTEFCTKQSCPTMNAGHRYEFRWASENGAGPIKSSAPEYIENLMDWMDKELSNEELFPCKPGVPFPPHFKDRVKQMFKRLFRVYAHIYHSHFHHISALEAEPHLNTSFKHFIYFVDEFKLIDASNLTPLQDLIVEIRNRKQKPDQQGMDSSPN